ncbi:IS110 family transposase, partial [Slackia isoflavoniconvertens]|uniref:IS110 family transposase n=1 Tax=Slackia isoflavoniconvertens TaxID=572010 RepID=UPI003AF0DDAC
MDVGKRPHWACLVTPEGEAALNRPVANDEHELSALFASVPKGTLLVVDQKRN